MSRTSAAHVLQFDLNANDRFATRAFPTALLYNSMNVTSTVSMNTTAAQAEFGLGGVVDLYETTTDQIIAKGVSLLSGVPVVVPAAQAIIVVSVPTHSTLMRSPDGQVSVLDGARGEPTIVRFRVP